MGQCTWQDNRNSPDPLWRTLGYNRQSPAEEIRGGGCEQSTEERSCRQDGNDKRLLGRGGGARSSWWVRFSGSARLVLRGLDPGNDTGIVTKENTTKGGEEGLGTTFVTRTVEMKTRRTERIPAQTFLGALAPMPSPVAIAPPAMIGEEVLVFSERRLVLWGGWNGGEGWVRGRRTREGSCFICEIYQAQKTSS